MGAIDRRRSSTGGGRSRSALTLDELLEEAYPPRFTLIEPDHVFN